jgi:hypothetical protein
MEQETRLHDGGESLRSRLQADAVERLFPPSYFHQGISNSIIQPLTYDLFTFPSPAS